MTHDNKIEHALKYLYNQGYGKGSNYTTMTIASLMVEYAEQIVKDKLEVALQQPPVISTFSKCECGGELIQISRNTNQCNKCFLEFHNI